MSRQPTLGQRRCKLQAQMFEEAAKVGGLDVQLAYYRGFGECRASRWVRRCAGLARPDDDDRLPRWPGRRSGGFSAHARQETGQRSKVNVLVFVGDAMEEKIDDLAAVAGELGLAGPASVFIFQEGQRHRRWSGPSVRSRGLSGGAYARFDVNAAGQLAELLRAAAVYAAGGMKALAEGGAGARLLLQQLR